MREELFNKLSKLGYKGTDKDVENVPLDDLVWCYAKLKPLTQGDAIKKANMALLIRAFHNYILSDNALYYISLPDAFPYQSSGDFGNADFDVEKPEIHIFSGMEAAEAEAEYINSTMDKRRKEWTKNEIVSAVPLGYFEGMNHIDAMTQYGVKYLILGEKVNDRYIRISLDSLQLSNIQNESTEAERIAPGTRAMLGFFSQAMYEGRTQREQDKYKQNVVYEAPRLEMGIAVDYQAVRSGSFAPMIIQIGDEDYIDAFTDWASLQIAYDMKASDEGVDIVWGGWDSIAKEKMSVCINRSIALSADEVRDLCMFTEKGIMACEYIAQKYDIDTSLAIGVDRVRSIFFDIHDAEPIWKEFQKGLSYKKEKTTDEDGNEGPEAEYVDFDFVDDGYVIHGVTAKGCCKAGLCDNPAAAYHVLALLYNDNDGSAAQAFDNAELYQ